MRVFAFCPAFCVTVALAACGQSAAPESPGFGAPPPSPQTGQPPAVRPANVMRVRSDLPPGYEVADLTGRSSPLALWGFGAQWVADPPQCGGLGDPAGDPAGDGAVQGFSASGPGGIIYAVVAETSIGFDPVWADGCATWSLTTGRTSGTVTIVGPPRVQGVATLGMATDAVNIVEGGTETRSHADTFIAHLGSHVAYVAVVTDPGSAVAPLAPDVAAGLLVETVSAVRG